MKLGRPVCCLCYGDKYEIEIPSDFSSSECDCPICVDCWNTCSIQYFEKCPVCSSSVEGYLSLHYPIYDSGEDEGEEDEGGEEGVE